MEFDQIIHQPIRLKIMSALATLPESERVDFSMLRKHLGVTDGNLGAHLRRLSSARYIEVIKQFVDGTPRTGIRASPLGRRAFLDHVRALEEIIRGPAALAARSPESHSEV